METCFQCNGLLTDEFTTLKRTVNGELFLIEDVPVQVCRRCGERYYDGPVMEKIEAQLLAREIDREITVPVVKYRVA
jgi:YgiT-type zinc finger domain-containing protein